MKRLLASLGFLILATGCDKNSPFVPQTVPTPVPSQASLTGVVTLMTVDGAMPVEGALVELLQNGDPSVMSVKPGKTRSAGRKVDYQVVLATYTDADGRYSFEGVGFGTYALRISKDGNTWFSSEEFQLAGDTEIDAELNLEDNGAPSRLRRVRR
jgi:protocatechuate 3,4-dioxygenase beta subunit